MIYFVLPLLMFFAAVIIHEYAHGWVANRLGDPTARYSGRLTLNPLAHVDLFGTIIFPLLLIMMRSPFIFGWAKPVPINFSNLNNPKKDIVWVGLAGPAANIAAAIILSIVLRIIPPSPAYQIIALAIWVNLILAVFNLIPIPPLDGSRAVLGLLPYPYSLRYAQIEPYGFLIIFSLIFLGLLERVILPIAHILARALGVGIT